MKWVRTALLLRVFSRKPVMLYYDVFRESSSAAAARTSPDTVRKLVIIIFFPRQSFQFIQCTRQPTL